MRKRKGCSCGEFAVIMVLLVILFVILMPGRQPAPPKALCQNNLKQMGLTFMLYADESVGNSYPPTLMQPLGEKGLTPIPSPHALYPEYLSDVSVLLCPASGDIELREFFWADETEILINEEVQEMQRSGKIPWDTLARSYNYYGWLIERCDPNDPTVDAATVANSLGMNSVPQGLTGAEKIPAQMAAIYQAVFEAQESAKAGTSSILTEDLLIPAKQKDLEGHIIHRLREGVVRFSADTMDHPSTTHFQSTTPVMWDTPTFNPEDLPHKPNGLNVLYMDGHVEFHMFPSDTFPVTYGMAAWSRFNEALLFGE